MRIVTPITVFALASAGALLGHLGDVDSLSDKLPFVEKASEVDVAVEVRCGNLESWQRRTCEEELTQRFASGNASPESVLRMHCTRARTVWDQALPAPPPLCEAKFGGWISS